MRHLVWMMRSQTKELEGYFASEGANLLQVKEVLSNCFKDGKVGHLVQILEQINEKKRREMYKKPKRITKN